MSTIVPLPKKTNAKELKDFRPVALTSVIAKCMERVVRRELMTSVADRMDPMQFAYRAGRGVEDAALTLTNLISEHLDKAGNYVRVLFMDLSAAFNTVQPHILLQKLVDLNVNSSIILWIRDFLSDRPQRVCVKGVFSDVMTLNTGVPQGCVLSPLLFSLYTNTITCQSAILALIKYADDMALVGLLSDENSLSQYFLQIQTLYEGFESSYLKLNTTKTEELIFGNKKEKDTQRPVVIGNQAVSIVESYKYLGTFIDSNLCFTDHISYICKKAEQRMYLLRKLKNFDVSESVLQKVYVSLIESVLLFNISVWFSHLTVKNKSRLARIVNTAGRLIGSKQRSLSELYQLSVYRKAVQIYSDKSHPLNERFQKLPSGRRLKVPLAKKSIFKRSFIPSAVSVLNQHYL